jgi:hypothetical protein
LEGAQFPVIAARPFGEDDKGSTVPQLLDGQTQRSSVGGVLLYGHAIRQPQKGTHQWHREEGTLGDETEGARGKDCQKHGVKVTGMVGDNQHAPLRRHPLFADDFGAKKCPRKKLRYRLQ